MAETKVQRSVAPETSVGARSRRRKRSRTLRVGWPAGFLESVPKAGQGGLSSFQYVAELDEFCSQFVVAAWILGDQEGAYVGMLGDLGFHLIREVAVHALELRGR
ncbi:hypothetical protein [Streptomyces sp. NPDC004266]|uniref:hypothetical protein n=1 Tax=Streptomyces sp. NPDC004266 TaxID=3364693 RepID=UPI0036B4377B